MGFLAFYFICFITNKCFYFLLGVFEASPNATQQLHPTADEASTEPVSAAANAKKVLKNSDDFQSDHKNPGVFFQNGAKTHIVSQIVAVFGRQENPAEAQQEVALRH